MYSNSIASNASTDYKVYKYTSNHGSVNHPSFGRRSLGYVSSVESTIPSRTRSEHANRYRPCTPMNVIPTSLKSEPIRKKPSMPLTEKTLAIHNTVVPPFENYQLERQEEKEEEEEEEEEGVIEEDLLEKTLLSKVNERCDNIQHDFEEKIKQLEAQFAKAELDFHQSRSELEELHSMEKEYINQGIQTELNTHHMDKVENELLETKEQVKEWKYKAHALQDYVNQTKKIIWDTPFIPVNAICRQLPTTEDDDDDEDICDYHRERIEKYKLKLKKEKELHRDDNNATLNKISNWSTTIKHY